MKHETERQIHVVEDRQRAICGYLAAADLPDERAEVIADTPEAASTLLAVFGARYLAAGIDRIRWSVPPDDLLVAYARQLLTVTVSARYQPNDGWLARLIDTQALVETLTPEIVAQARTTDPRFDPAALVFDCQPDVVQIGLQQRPNTVSRLGHRDFIQIMFGSLRPAALTTLHADAVHLLDTLFPPRMAAIAPWDWF
jgi:hypothetical protein